MTALGVLCLCDLACLLLSSFLLHLSLTSMYSHPLPLLNTVCLSCVSGCVPQDKEDLQLLLDDLRHSGGLANGHSEEMKKWPIAKVCVCE